MFFNLCGVDALTCAFDVAAADVTIRNCTFITATASAQADAAIIVSTVDRFCLENCVFIGTGDAGTAAALTIIGGDGHIIKNNIFQGAYSAGVGAIRNITTAMTNTVIDGNIIQNYTASSSKAITAVAGSTGTIRDNRMQILTGTAPITAAGMYWVGRNYYAATIATAGTLI